MKQKSFLPKTIILVALIITAGMSNVVMAQLGRVFSGAWEGDAKKVGSQAAAGRAQPQVICRGPIRQVTDIVDGNIRFTPVNFFTMPGGGEGGGFDKTPLITTRVTLTSGCLNAHLTAIVGSQLYGVAGMTMFQVTLTPTGQRPRRMPGHFDHPFGSKSPAVITEAERDVDMFAANFFQKVGDGPDEVPPGVYVVNVWWSGAGPGGAIVFSTVLKLYQ